MRKTVKDLLIQKERGRMIAPIIFEIGYLCNQKTISKEKNKLIGLLIDGMCWPPILRKFEKLSFNQKKFAYPVVLFDVAAD